MKGAALRGAAMLKLLTLLVRMSYAASEREYNPSSGDEWAGSSQDDNDNSLSFGTAFFNSWSLIIATELGDKTFFIAAIMCLKFQRLPVFAGALLALVLMTLLSAFVGVVLPAILSRKYTHFIAAILFFYFGIKLLHDGSKMRPGVVSEELAEVEEELGDGKKDDVGMSMTSLESNKLSPSDRKDLESCKSSDSLSSLSRQEIVPFEKVFTQSLTLTFLAEWGDRSQVGFFTLSVLPASPSFPFSSPLIAPNRSRFVVTNPLRLIGLSEDCHRCSRLAQAILRGGDRRVPGARNMHRVGLHRRQDASFEN